MARRLTAAEVHASRVEAARRGIERALRRRTVAYRRELERHVCEVGFDFRTTPAHRRPEPHQFSEAIQALVREGVVGERELRLDNTPYRFWHLASVDQATVDAMLGRKGAALETLVKVESNPRLAGWHAEGIHHRAMLAAEPLWLSVGWEPGHTIRHLGAHVLAAGPPGDVDLAGHHLPTAYPFVAQVKNTREWFYPSDDAIWNLLGAAAQLHAFPIFIARRLPEKTFALMKLVGGFAFRAVKTIFPPEIEHWTPEGCQVTVSQALRELGFLADADFIAEPLLRHHALWTGRGLAGVIEEAFPRFYGIRERVLEVAYDEGLASGRVRRGRRSGRDRREIFDDFYNEIRRRAGGRPPAPEGDEPPEED